MVGFAVVYSTPYLLSLPGANLGAKLGYIWAGFAGVGAIWAWFFLPELKNRDLEDIDKLFESKIPAWRFKNHTIPSALEETAAEKIELQATWAHGE